MFNILMENLSMKKFILKTFAALALAGGVASCGNDFLETNYYRGIDIDTGLNSVNNIGTALNGTYYRLFAYYFGSDTCFTSTSPITTPYRLCQNPRFYVFCHPYM